MLHNFANDTCMHSLRAWGEKCFTVNYFTNYSQMDKETHTNNKYIIKKEYYFSGS